MKREYHYDVAVAGGGPAGLAAALSAASCGARTVLIEQNGFAGGECASSNVPAYCAFFDRCDPPRPVVGGIGREFLEQLQKLGSYIGPVKTPGKNYAVAVEAETVKYIFDRMLEGKADVMLHTRVVDAQREEDRIVSVTCSDPEGLFTITADAFVDATGNAELSHLAGANTRFGRDGHVQAAAMVMLLDGFDPSGDYSSAVIAKAIEQGTADGLGPFSRRSGSVLRWLYPDCGTLSVIALQLDGQSREDLTRAETEGRKQAHAYLEVLRRYVPGMEKVRLISTGSTLGIREARTIIGTETLSGEAVLNGRHLPDGIGRGCWPSENHSDLARPAVFTYLPEKDSYYDIPFGILQPVNTANLFAAGRCVSADAEAFASVRVGGTCFVTGQAAGTAAALYRQDPENLKQRVREALQKQGAVL